MASGGAVKYIQIARSVRWYGAAEGTGWVSYSCLKGSFKLR